MLFITGRSNSRISLPARCRLLIQWINSRNSASWMGATLEAEPEELVVTILLWWACGVMLFIIIKKKFNLMQFLSKKPFLANNIYKLTSFLLYIIIFTRLTRKLISIHNITRMTLKNTNLLLKPFITPCKTLYKNRSMRGTGLKFR